MEDQQNKIKVAFFADILIKDFDGASRTMFQIIERIPHDRFEFLFFCGMPPEEDIGFEVVKVPSVSIPFNTTYKLAIPLFSWFSARKRLREFDPDVIHIASPSPLGNFAFHYNRKRNIPVITIYHTHFLSYISYYLRVTPFLVKPATKTVAFGQRKFYDQASLMYVPTMQMVRELKEYNFDTEKMKIWQRGMNHSLFNPSKRDNERIEALTGNRKPNVLFASRLVWEKNLATLIRIYRKSQEKGDHYNFIIAGDGVAYRELANKMPRAYMLGKVDHDTLASLYASADVFLFPSVSETYGNVVVEAMASGCVPVIARGGGSQSLVEHGVTGYLCDPENEDEYLENIEKVLGDSNRKDKMISEGIAYTKDLDWDSLVDVYFSDIQRLAESSTLPIDTVAI